MRPIKDIKTALNIYLNHTTLQSKQVMELFDVSRTRATVYIKEVRRKQIEAGIPIFVTWGVDTAFAYECWGIDIKILEKRYRAAQALGMRKEEAS